MSLWLGVWTFAMSAWACGSARNEADDDDDSCTDCGPSTTSTTGSAGSTGSGGAASGSGGEQAAGGSGAFSLTDSLKDGQPLGNVVGGTLGSNGWTVTAKTDRIWYALPRLLEGSIQFTVTGMTHNNLTLSDHEIFTLYDAGHSILEPINYNPEFRDNDYKQIIRIYGQMVPQRLGLQKFIMLMCPDGWPGYGLCECPMSFYDGDGWWGGDAMWDGTPTVIKVAWGNGAATYSRDGIDVRTNDYSSSGLYFGPEELHFTIGSARHDAISDAGMPIGATFSDVVVQGIDGGHAETCSP